MAISAIVIGYGSIGKRHARILSKMHPIGSVAVLSSQSGLPYKTIKTLNAIGTLDPDYIVIASPTAFHFKQLTFLEESLNDKIMLVEKPLFDQPYRLQPKNNAVWVAYVLRHHPVIQLIRSLIVGRQLWNVDIFCGSYLPEWRPGRDYRETSSARKQSGGGVLLDLSHELDYAQWLFGQLRIEHVYNAKVSSLEIETDDLLTLSGYADNDTRVHISLNYFTRKTRREIVIDGENISIQADLVNSKATVYLDGQHKEHNWADLEMDQLYQLQHEAVLAGNNATTCTYLEGLETMNLIRTIESFRNP